MDSKSIPDGRVPGFAANLAYGLGDLGFLIVWQASALFLLYFYTEQLGLPAWLAGAIFFAAMVWDAVSDPLIAAWAERHAARHGRYSPIIRWAALPVGVSFALMFTTPFSGVTAAAAWALLTHLAFRTAYTFASMPYNTLPLRLTRDTDARSSLSAARVVGAAFGALAAAAFLPALIGMFGYLIAAALAGAATSILLFGTGAASGETTSPSSAPVSTTVSGYLGAVAKSWTSIARNDPVLRLLAVMAAGTIGYGFFTSTVVFYMQHVFARPELLTLALALPALATIIAAPVWAILAARTSKRLTLLAGLFVAITGYLMLSAAAGGSVPVLLIAVCLAGAGGGAIPVMLWSMMPDAIEHGEAETGERVEARTFGLTTFVQKCAAGLTAVTAGALLSMSGYDAVTGPGEFTSAAITAMTSALPAAFMALIALAVWAYPIDRARHAAISERLAASRTEAR